MQMDTWVPLKNLSLVLAQSKIIWCFFFTLCCDNRISGLFFCQIDVWIQQNQISENQTSWYKDSHQLLGLFLELISEGNLPLSGYSETSKILHNNFNTFGCTRQFQYEQMKNTSHYYSQLFFTDKELRLSGFMWRSKGLLQYNEDKSSWKEGPQKTPQETKTKQTSPPKSKPPNKETKNQSQQNIQWFPLNVLKGLWQELHVLCS